MTDAWTAPYADGPVNARVVVPGSKSLTNRALILAALADAPSTVGNVLEARDTLLMIDALRALGVSMTRISEGCYEMSPSTLRGPARIDVGLAGTVMRFMPPVAALADGDVHFDGDDRARVRPMGAIIDALRQLGVAVDDDQRAALPFTVHGTGIVSCREVTIDASASSQFVSALLLSGARFADGVHVRHRGGDLPSLPHIDMTIEMLRSSNVDVACDTADSRNAWWSIAPGPIAARDRIIEPDLSNAAPFLAAAMVTGGAVTIPDWPAITTQAGAALRDILQLMGGQVEWSENGLTVRGPDQLAGVDIDMRNEGELAPTIAALCALATTPSRLRGIAHLRGHETDRLTALAVEINRLGGDAREEADGLTINPAPLHAGDVATYDDHRMATAGAIIGLVVPGVRVHNIETTRKTLPDFPGLWSSMLGGV